MVRPTTAKTVAIMIMNLLLILLCSPNYAFSNIDSTKTTTFWSKRSNFGVNTAGERDSRTSLSYSRSSHAYFRFRGGSSENRNANNSENGLPRTSNTPLQSAENSETAAVATYSMASSSSSYHLLQSKGTPMRIVGFTLALLSLQQFVLPQPLVQQVLNQFLAKLPCHYPPVTRIALPLLSSACCAVQLLVNAVSSLGCMGFNTALGPVRPFFVSILLINSIKSFRSTTALWIVGQWFIALLPEIVHWYNTSKQQSNDASASYIYKQGVAGSVITLSIPSMGCVSCINKIMSTLQTSDTNAPMVKSWLLDKTDDQQGKRGGMAEITVGGASPGEVTNLANDYMQRVISAGFQDCAVVTIEPKLSIEPKAADKAS